MKYPLKISVLIKGRLAAILAIALLSTPVSGLAQAVTWEVQGLITSVQGASSDFPNAAVGDAFRVQVTFDPDAALLSTDVGGQHAPGTRYRHDPSSILFRVRIGSSQDVEYSFDPASVSSLLHLQDDSGFVNGVPWDGITWQLHQPDTSNPLFGLIVSLVLRGSDTSIFDGPGLPTMLDPRLLSQEQRLLVITDNVVGSSVVGVITSPGRPLHLLYATAIPRNGSIDFTDFSILFDDTGDGLLQHDEIDYFSGVGRTVDPFWYYDSVAYVPEITGTATASGTLNTAAPCPECWEFGPGQAGLGDSDGWFTDRWSYAITAPPSTSTTVPAESCAQPGGCNPTGGQTIELPPGLVIPPGTTITQTVDLRLDPRVAAGTCGRESLVVPVDGMPDLIFPEYLCGSPGYAILLTESDLVIPDGTITTTNEPGAFVSNPLTCDSGIGSGIMGDPQQQDTAVWQPTDPADIREGHALEVTFECGSSRGKTRGLSYFVVGMHIDFGIDWDNNPRAVRRAFIDLTDTKLDGVLQSVFATRGVVSRRDFRRMVALAAVAKIAFKLRLYHIASFKLTRLNSVLEAAKFDTSGTFNFRGDVAMRVLNARFMIDEKIIAISR